MRVAGLLRFLILTSLSVDMVENRSIAIGGDLSCDAVNVVAAELDFIVSILVDLTLKLRPSINK